MSKIENILAGLGGAVALNLLHESLKKQSNVPRIDLLGEEALQKTLGYFGTHINDDDNLYAATLAGDVLSNSIYYSMIGGGSRETIWPRAIAFGLAAGIGAITLPQPMGLDPEPVTRTNQVKALTVAYYVAGALVTGLLIKAMDTKK